MNFMENERKQRFLCHNNALVKFEGFICLSFL